MTEAGRELDALVAEKVMGWEARNIDWALQGGYLFPPEGSTGNPHPIGPPFLPHYSTEIADAWRVVERLWTEHAFTLADIGGRNSRIPLGRRWKAGFGDGIARAATAPLAICLAALITVGIEPVGAPRSSTREEGR